MTNETKRKLYKAIREGKSWPCLYLAFFEKDFKRDWKKLRNKNTSSSDRKEIFDKLTLFVDDIKLYK